MDDERFDLVVRSLFASRSRRTVLGLALAGSVTDLFLEDAVAKKRRGKKKRKKRPAPRCGTCADNEECVGSRCVSLARTCRVEDGFCTTRDPALCGQGSDPVEGRGDCALTLGGNPICVRGDAAICRPCASHADCERQGWGPRGVCLSKGTGDLCCGSLGPALCSVPHDEPCQAPGEPCFQNADCCSDRCGGGRCRLSGVVCLDTGTACDFAFQCCSGDCRLSFDGRFCRPCVNVGQQCSLTEECCQQRTACARGACSDVGVHVCCKGLRESCSATCDCCLGAGRCSSNGVDPGLVCCRVSGDSCTSDRDCCEGWRCESGTCSAA